MKKINSPHPNSFTDKEEPINRDITIEDIRQWKDEIEKSGVTEREYKVYMITTKENFNKVWTEALIKAANLPL